jgi:DNA-binding Xre family transcriptional regulator
MTYRNAIKEVLEEEIHNRGLKAYSVSVEAGFSNNFLSRFLNGKKREITPDTLAPIAKVLGVTVGQVIHSAETKIQTAQGVE